MFIHFFACELCPEADIDQFCIKILCTAYLMDITSLLSQKLLTAAIPKFDEIKPTSIPFKNGKKVKLAKD